MSANSPDLFRVLWSKTILCRLFLTFRPAPAFLGMTVASRQRKTQGSAKGSGPIQDRTKAEPGEQWCSCLDGMKLRAHNRRDELGMKTDASGKGYMR